MDPTGCSDSDPGFDSVAFQDSACVVASVVDVVGVDDGVVVVDVAFVVVAIEIEPYPFDRKLGERRGGVVEDLMTIAYCIGIALHFGCGVIWKRNIDFRIFIVKEF